MPKISKSTQRSISSIGHKSISKSKKDTARIARLFLAQVLGQKPPRGARVVGLQGDLGAGKTAFVQAAARHLRVRETVNSPTFVLIKRYPIRKKGPHKYMFHLDAYRLKNERDLEILGWREILKNPEHLVFIEWPENVKKAMPRGAHRIRISHQKNGERRFEL